MSKYKKYIKYVQDHLQEDGYEKVAAHIGVTVIAFKKQISLWRAEGNEIPHVRKVPLGTISERNKRGVIYRFKKTSNGWVCIGRVTPYNDLRIGNKEESAPIRERKTKAPRRHKKPAPVILARRKDFTGYRSVRVDSKTTIQVEPGITDAQAIERWQKMDSRRNKVK